MQQLIQQIINSTIKEKPHSGLALLVQQRVNQQVVEQLLTLWHTKSVVSEVRSEVLASLKLLVEWFHDNNDRRQYSALGNQFILLAKHIEFSLEENHWIVPKSTLTMPPGSPIGAK